MSTSYDFYRDLAQTRAAAQGSLAVQVVQTGLLADISGSLGDLHSEMSQIRRSTAQGLAIQQEILQREIIQTRLEEFIYQMEKLVENFSAADCDCVPSSRFFLLRGILETIQKEGISTPLIKGRENKVAFEQCSARAKSLYQQLEQHEEVKDAIAWAKAEQRRLQEQKQQQTEEAERRKAERAAAMKQLESRIAQLKTTRRTMSFTSWCKEKLGQIPAEKKYFAYNGIAVFGLFLWPFVVAWYFVNKMAAEKEMNAQVDGEVQRLEQELRILRQQAG